MYVSDYGYAVGGSSRDGCLRLSIYDYYNNDCYTDDWIHKISSEAWFLTPYRWGGSSSGDNPVFALNMMQAVRPVTSTMGSLVIPTVYLSSNVGIDEGTGSESVPYHLVAS